MFSKCVAIVSSVVLAAIISSCNQNPVADQISVNGLNEQITIADTYSKLSFRRTGGGDKAFSVTRSESSFTILVNRYEFRDMSRNFIVFDDDQNSALYSFLDSLFRGYYDLSVEKTASISTDSNGLNQVLTGTWVTAGMFGIDDTSGFVLIDNRELLNRLRLLEQLVETMITMEVIHLQLKNS